jgi:hypothetical protein
MRARHRLSKRLLRHGIVYAGRKAWTGTHDRWLLTQRFELSATQAAFEDGYETVCLAGARRDRLDEKITAMAADSVFTPASPTGPVWCCSGGGTRRRPRREREHTPATSVCTPAGSATPNARNGSLWPTSPSPANWPAGAGRWQGCRTDGPPPKLTVGVNTGLAARGVTHPWAMSSLVP